MSKSRASYRKTRPNIASIKNASNPIPLSVEAFLHEVGLRKPNRSLEAFWSGLRRRFGRDANKLWSIIRNREEGNSNADVYKLKNTSLEFSLAVTSLYWYPIYLPFLEWFAHQKIGSPPKTILDVGCDNGVLTCFYARCFPDATVLGIDETAVAIRRARELSSKLGISNVNFETCTLGDLSKRFPNRCFDLVVGTTIYQEALGFPERVEKWGYETLASTQLSLNNHQQRLAEELRNIIVEDGHFISMERCPTEDVLWWWVSFLNKGFLSVDWSQSTKIRFESVGEKESLPALICGRKKTPMSMDANEVVAFWIRHEIEKMPDPWIIDDTCARVLFNAINPKHLLHGIQATWYNGSGTARLEAWSAGVFVLLFEHTTHGWARLSIRPNSQLVVLQSTLTEWADNRSGDACIERYDTLEAREQLSMP